MIRVTCSCKGSRGWKHIVNGHLFVTTRVGHLVTVLYQGTQRGRVQSAWEGTLTRGERAPTGEEGVPAGGGGGRGVQEWLPDLQSSPAYWPQTLLQSALGNLNSPAIYKA